MSETKPIAHRIMAAWMRLNGHSEDEIATHAPDSIEVELQNLEATVRMKDKPEMPIGWKCPDCGEFRGHGHEDVCPEAWVEISDATHHSRPGVDQVNALDNPSGKEWVNAHNGRTTTRTMRIRCRRKDLPVSMTLQSVAEVCESTPDPSSPFGDAMSQPASRVPVRLIGRRSGEVRWQELDESMSVHDVIIKYDANGFYVGR